MFSIALMMALEIIMMIVIMIMIVVLGREMRRITLVLKIMIIILFE